MESGKSTTQVGFGSSSSLSQVKEGEEEPDCVTTIGFGPRPTAAASSSNTAQVMNILNMLTSNKKSVSFAAASIPAKTTSLNTSNSTTDRDDDDDDGDSDEEDDESGNNSQNNNDDQPLNQANLFVSETERKKYLEQQFQEAVQDYGKILKRLEHDNLLNF